MNYDMTSFLQAGAGEVPRPPEKPTNLWIPIIAIDSTFSTIFAKFSLFKTFSWLILILHLFRWNSQYCFTYLSLRYVGIHSLFLSGASSSVFSNYNGSDLKLCRTLLRVSKLDTNHNTIRVHHQASLGFYRFVTEKECWLVEWLVECGLRTLEFGT